MCWVCKNSFYSFELSHISNNFSKEKDKKCLLREITLRVSMKADIYYVCSKAQKCSRTERTDVSQVNFCQLDDAFPHFSCRAFYRTTLMKLYDILYLRYMSRDVYCKPSQATESKRRCQSLGINKRHFKQRLMCKTTIHKLCQSPLCCIFFFLCGR